MGVFVGILCTVGLAFSVLVVALVEEMGLPDAVTFLVLAGGALLAIGAFGLSFPTMRIPEYFAAGRAAGAFHAGLAMVAGIAFIAYFGITGLDFTAAGDGAILILGATAAVLIVGMTVAGDLRRSGALTLPDYLAGRLGEPLVRPVALIALAAVALPFLAATIAGFGRLAAGIGGLDDAWGVRLAVAAVLAATVLGGARALFRSQLIQFLVLFAAYLLPALLLAAREYGMPAPAFLVGRTLHALGEEAVVPGGTETQIVRSAGESLRYVAMLAWIAIGAAALPHLSAPAMALKDERLARPATAWAAAFCVLLFIVAPGYAAFGRVADIGVFALPRITGMPFFMTALLAAGGLAAMTAAAAGTALALANALAHDLYFRMVDSRAPQGRRLVVARLLLVVLAVAAAWVAASGIDPMPLAAAAFSLGAAGLFPVLVLAPLWPRLTAVGAAAGMIVGLVAALAYMTAARVYGVDLTGALALAAWADPVMIAGFFGLLPGVLVMMAASLLTARRAGHAAAAPVAVVGERMPAAEEQRLVSPRAALAPRAREPSPALLRIRETFIRRRQIRG